MRRGGSPYNALSEGCSLGRADPPQEDEAWGDNTEMGRLAVTEELHAKTAFLPRIDEGPWRRPAGRPAQGCPDEVCVNAYALPPLGSGKPSQQRPHPQLARPRSGGGRRR